MYTARIQGEEGRSTIDELLIAFTDLVVLRKKPGFRRAFVVDSSRTLRGSRERVAWCVLSAFAGGTDRTALSLFCFEAVETKDRPATLGLGARFERYLAGRATLGAGRGIHLAVRKPLVLALYPAVLAALRSCEYTLGVEGLFTLGERESRTAVAAGDLLISHIKEKKEVKDCNLPSFLECSVLVRSTKTKAFATETIG